jgi:hypothetical protein
VNICEACEQFESRVKQWDYTNGAIGPLPYLDELIKPHKHLMLEGIERDGTGSSEFLFHCLKCEQLWKLSAWAAVGQLNVWPYLPKHHSSQ